MKRAWPLVALLACASNEPRHTEVAIAPLPTPSAKPAASEATDEELLAMISPDAGVGGLFGDSIDEDDGALRITLADAGARSGTPVIRQNSSTLMVGIAPEVIRRVIRTRLVQLRTCYERTLVKHRDLAGRVTVRFTIDPAGNVSKAESAPTSTMPSAEVVSCVLDAFKTIQFPRPQGGSVIVTYPIVFAPG